MAVSGGILDDAEVANINCIDDTKSPQLRCLLCNCDLQIKFLDSHVKADKHSKKLRCYKEALELINYPAPSTTHVQHLTQFLEREAQFEALPDEDIRARIEAVDELNEFVRKIAPTCSVRLFGSLLSGFATIHSDINVDLVIDHNEAKGNESAAELLARISAALQQSPEYSDLVKEFNIKVPKLYFTRVINDKMCKFELILTAERSRQTSELLRTYCDLDARLKTLGLCIKKWARCCWLDDQENGTWPSHAFIVMMIHYLQRCSPPILPYLQEAYDRRSKEKPEDAEEASVSTEANEAGDGGDAEDAEDPVDVTIKQLAEMRIETLKKTWRTSNTESVGEIWLGFWRYFAIEFRTGKVVVSIRKTPKDVKHKDKGWSTRVLAIEEPCKPVQNLSRSVGSMQIFEVFMYIVRKSYEYYRTPYVNSTPLFYKNQLCFKYRVSSDVDQTDDGRSRTLSTVSSVGDVSSNDSDSDDDEYSSEVRLIQHLVHVVTFSNDSLQFDRLVNKRDQSASYRLAKSLSDRFGHTKELPPELAIKLDEFNCSFLEFRLDLSSLSFFKRK